MEVPFRPLGKVMELASKTGLDITFAFDDLVFSEHSIFVIRFDKEIENQLFLYFNQDCEEDTMQSVRKTLLESASEQNLLIKGQGRFKLTQKEESEELDIEFIESKI